MHLDLYKTGEASDCQQTVLDTHLLRHAPEEKAAGCCTPFMLMDLSMTNEDISLKLHPPVLLISLLKFTGMAEHTPTLTA